MNENVEPLEVENEEVGAKRQRSTIDPLLMELLRKIPKTDWPADNRVRWFRTFAMNVSQVYDEDAPIELEINVKKD